MTDNELDEMLNQWNAPAVSAALRDNVRAGFTVTRRRGRRGFARWFAWLLPGAAKGMFAGVAVGAVLLLLAITQAFPQTLGLFSGGFRIPYIMESELIRYADDGSPRFEAQIMSFMNGGDQIILTETDSATDPLRNMVRAIGLSVRTLVLQVAPSLVLPTQSSDSVIWHRAFVSNGCLRTGDTVIGHETILGHLTTVVRMNVTPRVTQWMAPDLGCAALKMTMEERRPDGTYRLLQRSRALRITMNR